MAPLAHFCRARFCSRNNCVSCGKGWGIRCSETQSCSYGSASSFKKPTPTQTCSMPRLCSPHSFAGCGWPVCLAKEWAIRWTSWFRKARPNKRQSFQGYGSAILVSHWPEGVCPVNGTWEQPLKRHTPRLLPTHLIAPINDKSMWTPMNRVDFLHAVPKAQNSVTTFWTCRLRRRDVIGGQIQSRDFAGFSQVAEIPKERQRNKNLTEKRSKMLPILTLVASAGLKFASPKGWLSLRRGGGPPGWSRAREKELHGVPRCPPKIRPDFAQL